MSNTGVTALGLNFVLIVFLFKLVGQAVWKTGGHECLYSPGSGNTDLICILHKYIDPTQPQLEV